MLWLVLPMTTDKLGAFVHPLPAIDSTRCIILSSDPIQSEKQKIHHRHDTDTRTIAALHSERHESTLGCQLYNKTKHGQHIPPRETSDDSRTKTTHPRRQRPSNTQAIASKITAWRSAPAELHAFSDHTPKYPLRRTG